VVAFEEVCPERIDLIHKNYRKLCNLLVDVEDWGQVAIISMLTRYARSQFADPNAEGQEMGVEKFYSSENEESSESDSNEEEKKKETEVKKKPYVMDPDHRLLLQSTKPLLQSRNTAVVMSVAQLYFHTAPAAEMSLVIRPIVRLLRSHREIQYIVLSNIATITTTRKVRLLNLMVLHCISPCHRVCLSHI
jgi:AP-3 complex subunit beta